MVEFSAAWEQNPNNKEPISVSKTRTCFFTGTDQSGLRCFFSVWNLFLVYKKENLQMISYVLKTLHRNIAYHTFVKMF